MNNHQYYVYLITNDWNTVLYIGVTNNLERRVHEHSNSQGSFTSRYKLNKLVYFEETNDIKAAIEREKQLKSWSRKRKDALINSMNPEWKDLLVVPVAR